ncbi:MAG: phenylalanine--tRNA ligase subunit beta [Candidatus Thermoplasmatota archaeon]|nr:phenylalanine--tRNA ligase subunit beta [Candidatus Thermoplasmatota archaeon]
MPVINMDITDLERLVGEGFSLDEFVDRIPMIGASVEKFEGNEISVEFFPDRPDLFCIEGVARAYRDFIGKGADDIDERPGISGPSDIDLVVDPSILKVRPFIGAAYITGVNIDERTLVSIMNLQEKLHITIGRKRKKVAIGIHDAGPIRPPFRYWAAAPDEVEFVPLQKEGKWNLGRILAEHEKGIDYAWVLEGCHRYPIITDSNDQVLSFPPIINGELTRVSEQTRDIFVDCTGWDLNAITLAVNIVCSQLMDRGGKLHSVKITYPDQKGFSELGLTSGSWPRFEWKETSLDLEWSGSWLGMDPGPEEVIGSLSRMGYRGAVIGEGKVTCKIPPWRGDILHPADVAEDLAIGYGLENFAGGEPNAYMTGNERKLSTVSRDLRRTLIGLGFLEVRTIALSNEGSQFDLMGREPLDHVSITNPITTEHTMMRCSSIPSLLGILKANKHRDLPQRIFETADIMVGNWTHSVLSGLSEDSKASFTEIKGVVQRILSDLELDHELEPASLGCYIRGRSAAIMVKGKDASSGPFPELEDGKRMVLGHFGEIHPRMITAMELSAPVSGFEMDLDLIVKIITSVEEG